MKMYPTSEAKTCEFCTLLDCGHGVGRHGGAKALPDRATCLVATEFHVFAKAFFQNRDQMADTIDQPAFDGFFSNPDIAGEQVNRVI